MLVATRVFSNRVRTFSTAVILISFSSGIIILFCYCSRIFNYEKNKSNKVRKIAVSLIVFTLVIASTEEKTYDSSVINSRTINSQIRTISVAIVLVILRIICVNKRIFQPKKSRITIY